MRTVRTGTNQYTASGTPRDRSRAMSGAVVDAVAEDAAWTFDPANSDWVEMGFDRHDQEAWRTSPTFPGYSMTLLLRVALSWRRSPPGQDPMTSSEALEWAGTFAPEFADLDDIRHCYRWRGKGFAPTEALAWATHQVPWTMADPDVDPDTWIQRWVDAGVTDPNERTYWHDFEMDAGHAGVWRPHLRAAGMTDTDQADWLGPLKDYRDNNPDPDLVSHIIATATEIVRWRSEGD